MGHLRDRIGRTSDNYYVYGEGYRDARRRVRDNRFNNKMNYLTLAIGLTLILWGITGWIKMGLGVYYNDKAILWGLGITAFGILTTWLTRRGRINE